MNDLISREAAIEKFEPWLKVEGYGVGELNMLRAVLYELSFLPSVQPKQQWIPISENLPDDLEEVIVTWVNHNPAPYYDFTKDKPSTGAAVFYKKQWFWSSPTCVDYLAEYGMCDTDKIDDDIEITAWIPLPKPYQGGVSE